MIIMDILGIEDNILIEDKISEKIEEIEIKTRKMKEFMEKFTLQLEVVEIKNNK